MDRTVAPASAETNAAEGPAPSRGPRTTAKSVLIFDKVAGGVIRSGGLMVIVALLGILAFLVATVWPLFKSAHFDALPTAGSVPVEGSPFFVALDEYRVLGVAVGAKPEIVVFRPDDPREVIARVPVPFLEGGTVTAAYRTLRSEEGVLATSDGRLAFVDLGFTSDFLLDARLPALRASMRRDEIRNLDGGVVQRVVGGNLLRIVPRVRVRGGVRLPASAGAVRCVGYATAGEKGAALAVTGERDLWLIRSSVSESEHVFAIAPVLDRGPVAPADAIAALVDEEARTAWVASRGGGLLRVDLTADPAVRREVKWIPGLAGGSARLSAAGLLIGGRSVLVGDTTGGLSVWSLVHRKETPEQKAARAKRPDDTSDDLEIERLHDFGTSGSAVTALSASPLRRGFFAGHADGRVTLGYATNARVLGDVVGAAGAVVTVAVGPKDDGILVVGPGGAYRGFSVENPHPETNAAALFGKVHYEGYDAPDYKYQSGSATQESELQLSLVPLLFGTLKGTFYAMLFALPLALLAAIYTSQFMHPKVRSVVKPGIEVMASLPSVVLGFIAARVIAPAVETIVPAMFAAMLVIPSVGFLLGCLWHVAPVRVKHGVSSLSRLWIALALVAASALLCVVSNGAIASTFFGGDFKAWLRGDGGLGDGTALLAVGLFGVGTAVGFFLVPRLPFFRLSRGQSPGALAGRTAAFIVLPGLILALATPWIRDLVFRGDFRAFLIGAKGTIYVQQNSLVVGLAMGFAVIPIIYTIAEDALIAIPDSLRSASLACGASPWQTAMRVVLPAAVPGIFSAVMVGLGRAIGETMIVVMATGGTAIIDGSMFNGFRTLSANIATELPEAPAEGTLYRVLFLAGLLLFVLTFVVNTVAEMVRLRFRKKFRGL